MPRSLNDPVGIANSSLKRTAAPPQSPVTSGVQPSPRLTASSTSTSSAFAYRQTEWREVSISARPSPGAGPRFR